MKNRILFILCVVLLFTYAAGCAAPADTSPDDTVTAAPETEAETDDLLFRDDLPERDFEGFSFNLYTRENTTHYHFLVENQNGEVLNDAIFTRNSNVSERFNVEFTEVTYVDENLARTTIMAGDDSFSMMNVRCSASNVLASQGLVHSVNSLPYINLDKGYWDRELTEALTVGGKSYFAIGATNLSTYDFMSVLLFNKKLIDDFGLDSPYELVNSGKWTFDRFGEMGAAVTTDINGDGKYNASDTFGLLGVAKYTQVSLLTAADTMMI
jgi:ABC-type glycerol-3-phosphate transport system substrate-binding protein